MGERAFIARRPRHEVQSDHGSRLVITRVETGVACVGQLGDFSRQGLKAIVAEEFAADSLVDIHIQLPHAPLLLAEKATVRWSKLQPDGQWAVGVTFATEVPWEIMGELFLHGVLAAE